MPSKIRGGNNDKHMADMHVPRVSAMAKPGGAAFAPTDISGLKVWLKADSLSLNDADPVTTWTDSSGSGNNATQAVAGSKPTYKVNILNGKPVVRFATGAPNDYMTIADSASYKTVDITLYVVATQTGDGSCLVSYPHAIPHSSPYFRWVIYRAANKMQIRWNGTAGTDAGTIGTGFHLFGLQDNDAYLDGTKIFDGVDANLTYPNATGCYIGANADGAEGLSGDIAEILLYDSSLSAGNNTLVKTYLATKYGLTVA